MSIDDPYRRVPLAGSHDGQLPPRDVLAECPLLSHRRRKVGSARFRTSWPASAVDQALFALEHLRVQRTNRALQNLAETIRALQQGGTTVMIEEVWE